MFASENIIEITVLNLFVIFLIAMILIIIDSDFIYQNKQYNLSNNYFDKNI